jgi:hypothetical protein
MPDEKTIELESKDGKTLTVEVDDPTGDPTPAPLTIELTATDGRILTITIAE